MNKLYLLGALAGALLLSSTVHANTLDIKVSQTGYSSLNATGSGTVSISDQSIGDFTVESVIGTGTPVFSEPYLDLEDLDVTKNFDNTTATLTIELTETGLKLSSSPLGVISSFTGNLNGVTSETISTYYDPSDTAYGMANLLGTATFTDSGSNSLNQFGTITDSGYFSETEVIVATFGVPSGGPDSLNSSALITAAPVPEPVSMGIAGAGLFAFGLVGVRRRKKA